MYCCSRINLLIVSYALARLYARKRAFEKEVQLCCTAVHQKVPKFYFQLQFYFFQLTNYALRNVACHVAQILSVR